jgi:hypothetical protein
VDPARLYTFYWEAWDALQAFPRARIHASYPPYVLSNIPSANDSNEAYLVTDDEDRGEESADDPQKREWRHTPSASR